MPNGLPVIERVLAAPVRVGRQIVTPFQLAIGADERLRVVVNRDSTLDPLVMGLQLRILTPAGELHTTQHRFNFVAGGGGGGGLASAHLFPLRDGYLVSVIGAPAQLITLRGRVAISAAIVKGSDSSNLVTLTQVLQGFPTNQQPVCWPGSPLDSTSPAVSYPRTVTVANPAAGADWSAAVPVGTRWRLQTVRAVLISDATVAARRPHLAVRDAAGDQLWVQQPANTVAANEGWGFSWGAGCPHEAGPIGGTSQKALPVDLELSRDMVVGSNTTFLQAGDQWSAIRVHVHEFLELDA